MDDGFGISQNTRWVASKKMEQISLGDGAHLISKVHPELHFACHDPVYYSLLLVGCKRGKNPLVIQMTKALGVVCFRMGQSHQLG